MKKDCFIPFQASIEGIIFPQRFTFPFYYQPHPLSQLAAQELQVYLEGQKNWEPYFGMVDEGQKGAIGKMFGVLVVENKKGEIGYLTAFSGKLIGKNKHPRFVPPIFDMLEEHSFFRKGEKVLNALNRKIEILENSTAFINCQEELEKLQKQADKELSAERLMAKQAKKTRKQQREKAKETLSLEAQTILGEKLRKESIRSHFLLKDLSNIWKARIARKQEALQVFLDEIAVLKQDRKQKSGKLQQQLFDQYQFLNQAGKTKSVCAIFEETAQKIPPAGAGECAAPKLLQYAFQNGLKPITMGEFWWGKSPDSAIRKHRHFYPACRGKCEPILAHMLEGMVIDDNPMLSNPAIGKTIQILHEDEALLIINKPSEFLSVPGKTIQDSVYTRIQQQLPSATGPLIVHRLDMSTSGLMVIAKTKESHRFLQYQFINRMVQKRYIALLDGKVERREGLIDLPLRVDLDNRPQQLVCYEYGKSAVTTYEVIDYQQNQTRIHFYPLTGRTHQLRVHAAHPLGLNTAIIGDDLYGQKGRRLYLHAEWITFQHPITREKIEFTVEADF